MFESLGSCPDDGARISWKKVNISKYSFNYLSRYLEDIKKYLSKTRRTVRVGSYFLQEERQWTKKYFMLPGTEILVWHVNGCRRRNPPPGEICPLPSHPIVDRQAVLRVFCTTR